jgi:hypothetical protein
MCTVVLDTMRRPMYCFFQVLVGHITSFSRSTTKHSEFGLAASVCLAISQLANQLDFIHFKDMKMSTPSKSQST